MLFLISYSGLSQSQAISIRKMEGLWIQEDFYKSFNKTRSITASKHAFIPELPVGLRINLQEVEDSVLNIGYAVLHDHMTHPEVSKYLVQGKDKFSEQGHLSVDLRKTHGNLPLNVGYIMYFNDDSGTSVLQAKIIGKDTVLVLTNEFSGSVKYKKFKEIDPASPYANPLYYYTRNKVLEGEYQLMSAEHKLLSSAVLIQCNGSVSGYKDVENKKIYYSTDIYCGMPIYHDVVMICRYPVENYLQMVCDVYIVKRNAKGDLTFYEYNWDDEIALNFNKKKKVKYVLKRMK